MTGPSRAAGVDVVPSLRERLDSGRLVVCMALVQARTADIPMVAAACGYDAVYIDLEHTSASFETTSVLCAGAVAAGIPPLVRVPSQSPEYLTRSLDVGALGVIVPHVETREEAEAIADACRFPPRGSRSVTGGNVATRHRPMAQSDQLELFDRETVVTVMLETPAAVDAASDIASVPGVDMVMLGPHDLTAEMGILGQFHDERFLDAVDTVAAACRTTGKAFAIAGIRDPELLKSFVGLGLRFVSAGTDAGFLAEAASAHAARLRAIAGQEEDER